MSQIEKIDFEKLTSLLRALYLLQLYLAEIQAAVIVLDEFKELDEDTLDHHQGPHARALPYPFFNEGFPFLNMPSIYKPIFRYSEKELEYFDKRSTENMLWFYREEFKKIRQGIPVRFVLGQLERKNLTKNGLLSRKGGNLNNPVLASSLAMDLLADLDHRERAR